MDPLATGRTQLNSQLVDGAKSLAGPAADLATGAGLFQTAANALKGAALEKLLGPTAIFAGGLVGVLAVIRNIVRESGILERGLANISRLQQIQGKFETLLKGAEQAKQRIKELYEFTANSPFKFESVAEANRILESLTRGAFSSASAMKMVGDSAAATGNEITSTAEEVGKLYNALASGRSIDRVVFQMQAAGLATDGLFSKLETLENAGAGFAEKWSVVTQALAANSGGMKNEMQTLGALQTKLGEADALMTQAFAKPFEGAQAKSIEVMTAATKNLTPVLKSVGEDLATVSGLLTNFKTGIVENTLATGGMATGMRAAWEVGKGLFLTLSGITALHAVMGAGKGFNFVTASAGAARKSLQGSLASDAGIAAKASGVAVGDALAAGNVGLAASESYVAAKFYATAGAAAVKTAALEGAAGASGLAAVRNGALGAASAVAAGGLSLVARTAVSAGKAIAGAFAAAFLTPEGMIITAVYGIVKAVETLTDASNKASDELDSTTKAVAELNAEMNRAEGAFRTTDDWSVYLAKLTDKIAEAEQAAAKFHDTMAKRSPFETAVDFLAGADAKEARNGDALDKNASALRKRRELSLDFLPTLGMGSREAEAYSRDLRNTKDRSLSAFQNKLSLADERASVKLLDAEIEKTDTLNKKFIAIRSSQEKFDRRKDVAAASDDLGLASKRLDIARTAATAGHADASGSIEEIRARRAALAAQQATLEASMPSQTTPMSAARADAAGERFAAVADKTGQIREQIALMDKVIAATDAEKVAEATLADMRRQSGSELVQNQQRLADLRDKPETRAHNAAGDAIREEIQSLEKRNLALVEGVKLVDEEVKRLDQLKFERTQRANAAEILAAITIPFDQRINAATARGDSPEASRLALVKEIATIEMQIAQQRKLGGNEQGIAVLKAQKAGIVAQETARRRLFQIDRGVDREANDATIRRQPREALGIRDAKELADLKLTYRANGLTERQASEDFAQRLRVEALNGGGVVASSLASIGGGGGIGTGISPADAAQQRLVSLGEAQNGYLRQLVEAATRQRPDIVNN